VPPVAPLAKAYPNSFHRKMAPRHHPRSLRYIQVYLQRLALASANLASRHFRRIQSAQLLVRFALRRIHHKISSRSIYWPRIQVVMKVLAEDFERIEKNHSWSCVTDFRPSFARDSSLGLLTLIFLHQVIL
jgi:hypothetical protein